MDDLHLNKYRIKEIVYELNEHKTAIFKFNNFCLNDVEVIDKLQKPKELHEYEPTSCLRTEEGMQETLNASRKKEWKEGFLKNKLKNTLNSPDEVKKENENKSEELD